MTSRTSISQEKKLKELFESGFIGEEEYKERCKNLGSTEETTANEDTVQVFEMLKKEQKPDALIQHAKKNKLFEQLAGYLLERADSKLWSQVFEAFSPEEEEETEQKHQILRYFRKRCDKNPVLMAEQIAVAVRGIMQANLLNEMIFFLEDILLTNPVDGISMNKNLQNLLLLTALKSKSPSIKRYIAKLTNYDGIDIAKLFVTAELFEEAFQIYIKFNSKINAIDILINNIHDIDRARIFATSCNDPNVLSHFEQSQNK